MITTLLLLDKNQLKRHIFFWALIFLYLNIYSPVPGSWAAKIIGGSLDALNYLFVFYSMSLFVFPKYWESKRVYLFACIIIVYIVFSVGTYYNYLKIIPYFGGSIFYQKNPISILLIDDGLYFFILGLAGSASFFYRYSVYNLKLQTEKEKLLLNKELNFLKNQFNSHITFNFFNYCYSKVHRYSSTTAESILLFSDMLRYTLQTKPEEKAHLPNEILNIENFIKLQKLLNDNVCVNFNYKGEIESNYISPRILITFVENAFKHGLYNNPHFPILIDLQVNNDKLVFRIRNKVNRSKNLKNGRTNLKNVKQILDLYYFSNYELKIEEKDGYYNIELQIGILENSKPLNEKIVSPSLISPEKKLKSVTDSYQEENRGLFINFLSNKVNEKSQKRIVFKPLMSLSKTQIQRHIISWLLIIIYLIARSRFNGTWLATIIGYSLIVINYMFVFYSLDLFVFSRFWENKRIKLIVAIFTVLILFWINVQLISIITKVLGGQDYIQTLAIWDFLNITFYFFLIAGAAGVASFFCRFSLNKLKQQSEYETAILSKEINNLRNQFNSQITFDFLDYCYTQVVEFLPEVASSIKLFSNMLKYTLETPPEGKVALCNEISYIVNFIAMQKLLSARVYVDFNCSGKIENIFILPRILITFVENAFKHGLYNDLVNPIWINLEVNGSNLSFMIKNKINHHRNAISSNTGLDNVTKILNLYYQNIHKLTFVKNDGFYTVDLILNFNDVNQLVLLER